VRSVSGLLPFVIVGIATGSLYGLAGLGLVLTYRTSGVFNFGHGAIAAAAAFAFYTLHVTHGLPWPLAAAITMVFFGVVVGLILERVTLGLADAPPAVVVVLTIGVLLGIDGYLYLQYGDFVRHFPSFLPASGFTVSGVLVSWAQVISALVALTGACGLYVFLRTSRLGVYMRAVVDDPRLVGLTGQRPARVRRAAWVIGSSFAALSGILLAPTLGLDANLLTFLVVQAFGACAIGMFSSLPLTYLGGLIVGISASVATRYLTARPWNGIPAAVPFLVLIAVLLVVPVAKLPQHRQRGRNLVSEAGALSRTAAAGLVVTGGVGLLLVPAVVGVHLSLWTAALVEVVLLGSLAVLTWTSGQISLCHAAFAAVGATTMGHLTANHVPWTISLVVAGLAVVPVGALIAIPAIRLSGIYLALVTLGFGILMQDVVYQSWLMFGTKPTLSAPRPQLAFLHGTNERTFYYLVLAVAALTCVALVAIHRGRLGRLLRAMADTPTMLATHGLSVNITRLIVFCVSAFFAGVAGALMIAQSGAVSSTTFGPVQSLVFVAVLATCGTRLLRSTILAAALITIVPGYASTFSVDRQTLAFGAAAVLAGLVLARRAPLAVWLKRAARDTDERRQNGPVAARTMPLQMPAAEQDLELPLEPTPATATAGRSSRP
jgi:branched-subunit amino acid ABC-type transport system permease component